MTISQLKIYDIGIRCESMLLFLTLVNALVSTEPKQSAAPQQNITYNYTHTAETD